MSPRLILGGLALGTVAFIAMGAGGEKPDSDDGGAGDNPGGDNNPGGGGDQGGGDNPGDGGGQDVDPGGQDDGGQGGGNDNPVENFPEAGPITAAEKASADAALSARPNQVGTDVVPAPDNVRKPGVAEASWLANVALWNTYRAPGSAWRLGGMTAGPVKISDPKSPWAAAWNRINAYLLAALKKAPGGQVEKPATAPPPGQLTQLEKQAADAIVLGYPMFFPNSVDVGTVPAPTNTRKQGVSDETWAANLAYWAAYRAPTSEWVKLNGQGPAQSPVNTTWATAWLRISAYIAPQIKAKQQGGGQVDKPAAGPPAGQLTQLEKQAADAVVLGYPMFFPNSVDVGTVPAPTNTRKPGVSDEAWAANLAYWATYRAPTSAWVKLNGQGPAQSPVNTTWATAWSRIAAYLGPLIKAKQGQVQPAAAPPAGQLTQLEKQAADAVVLGYPMFFPSSVDVGTVPAPTNARKPGVSDETWAANLAYWAAYRAPTSEWVKLNGQGPAQSPLNTTWATAWSRIAAYLGPLIKAKQGQAQPAAAPPAGQLTQLEKQAADAIVLGYPMFFPNSVDVGTVPAPTNARKPGVSDETWAANLAYWAAYRAPTSEWVKLNGQGPAQSPANTTWATAWLRIAAYLGPLIKAKQGQGQGQVDKPAAAPPAGQLTQLEKQAADAVVLGYPLFFPNSVDVGTVPAPTNTRKPGVSDETWAANLAYWAAYRAPTSEWVKLNGQGPAQSPANTTWATAWLRLAAYLGPLIKAKQGG